MTKRLFQILAFPLLLALTLTSSFTAHAESVGNDSKVFVVDSSRRPDFIVQALFDDQAQKKLLAEMRSALRSTTGFDPLAHRFPKSLNIEAQLKSKMGELLKSLIEGLLRFPFETGDILIDIDGLSYKTPNASLRIGTMIPAERGMDIPVEVRLRDTQVHADRVRVHFRSNEKKRSFLDVFYIELRNPTLTAKKLDSLTVNLTVKVRTEDDGSTRLSLAENSYRVFEAVNIEELRKELVLDPGEISIPESSLQIQGHIGMNADGFREALNTHKAKVADIVFRPLVAEIKKIPEKVFKRGLTSVVLPPVVTVDLPCLGSTGFRLVRYGQMGSNQIFTAISVDHPEYLPTVGQPLKLEKSTDMLTERIASRQVSVGVGIRDRFIGWALLKSLKGCLKDKVPPTLTIGSKGLIAKMDAGDGPDGVFAIHAVSVVKKFAGMILGSRSIEFPVKVSPTMDFRSGDTSPKLTLDLSKADLSNEILLNGFLSIPSNVRELRLKKMVLKKVRSQLETGLANAKIEVPLSFLRGSDLSYADLESDGFGHLNLLLTLDPAMNPSANNFWRTLAPVFRTAFQPKDERPGTSSQ